MRAYDFLDVEETVVKEIAEKFDLDVDGARVKIQITAEIHDWSLKEVVEHLLNPSVQW